MRSPTARDAAQGLADQIERRMKAASLLGGAQLREAMMDLGRLVYVESTPIITALRSAGTESGETQGAGPGRALPIIEFHQHDFIPGFAAFAPSATTPGPDSRAFCVVNLGATLAAIQSCDMHRSELPYHLAESMMHEVIHVIEQWAGAEFSEERVEALLDKYREAYASEGALRSRTTDGGEA